MVGEVVVGAPPTGPIGVGCAGDGVGEGAEDEEPPGLLPVLPPPEQRFEVSALSKVVVASLWQEPSQRFWAEHQVS